MFETVNSSLHMEDVFKKQGVPDVTFVPPNDYEGLRVSLRTPGRGVVIEGPSGIGKTTAVRTALTSLSQAGDLPYSEPLELSARKTADIEVIDALPQMGDVGMVVVDDFHRLPEASRERLSDYLKTLADAEDKQSKLILVGINRAGDSLIRLAPDLNNRIDIIRFEANPPELVERVFTQGAEALNVEFVHLGELVSVCYGSFYLAQMLAHQTCLASGVTETLGERFLLDRPVADTRERILEELDRNFYGPTRDFCRGRRPRPRGNAPYMRLLYWLSMEEDWTLSVQNKLNQEAAFRGSVGQIVNKGHVSRLVTENEDIGRVLSWDEESQILAVQDPQYIFYLKNLLWAKVPWRVGYRAVSFPPTKGKRYDVALSFAGAQRSVARALFDRMTEEGLEVFFDENEEHRILAESVETYLAPIYESESIFVVVLMSAEYPTRIWTKFESDAFERRFGENAVIPVWYRDAQPQMFDTSRKVGGFAFDPDSDHDAQIWHFTEMIVRKIEEHQPEAPDEGEVAEEIEEED